jgi:lambda family phage portal protein
MEFQGSATRAIDAAILALSPVWAERRIAARSRVEAYSVYGNKLQKRGQRSFDAAIRDRRTAGWNAPATSSSTETRGALAILRNRARELRRNSAWASKAERTIVARTIGTGFQPKPRTTDAALSAAWLERWLEWSEDPQQIDADGLLDFAGLQNLMFGGVVGSGETIVRRRKRRMSDGLSVPLQIQLLEADHLDETKDFFVNIGNGSRIIQGVEVNGFGKRTAYHLFRDHPGDSFAGVVDGASIRVAARDIAHVFRVERIGQVRGIPWGAPVFLRLKDWDGFVDAEILKQEISSTFVGFVQDASGPDEQSPLGKRIEDEGDDEVNQFEPGTWQRLNAGESITFGKPEAFSSLMDYSTLTLREVAAGYGTTYEDLSGDYSKVNFSSGRMGHLANEREVMTWRRCVVIPAFCNRVWKWFVEASIMAGHFSEAQSVGATWTPPRRDMIDPTKETAAVISQIEAGLMSLSEAARATGRTRDEILDELAADRLKAKELDLDLSVFAAPPAPMLAPEPVPAETPDASTASKADLEDEDDDDADPEDAGSGEDADSEDEAKKP